MHVKYALTLQAKVNKTNNNAGSTYISVLNSVIQNSKRNLKNKHF